VLADIHAKGSMPTQFDLICSTGVITRRTSFGVDLLSGTDHTKFSGPETDPTNSNFGRVTSQRGLSRVIQLNLRFDF
jgi:hypothetical protein